MLVEFDEPTHTYHVDGIRRPSVTEIIYAAGLVDDRYFTEESRNRGKFVHVASHYLDEGDLDLASVPDRYRGYLDAWVNFKEQSGFTPELIEHRIFNPTYGYCGTLDRTGRINSGSSVVLLDIKTGLDEPWHSVQLGAYSRAFEKPDKFRKMTVLLRKNGSFRVKECEAGQYRAHWNTFLACVELFNFKSEGKHVSSREHASSAA